MGRPPCCEKVGVKKGPWTPEEDIILVSYIQEHGPGNWRAVPTNTGLLRCSKSCRLRWTNYLRPGIKRGNFTDQEEKLIIHLQALLGNRWAAIASYLPERTDNDIKNYWNTHLNKKLRKFQTSCDGEYSKGQWERRLQTDINTARKALCDALSLDKPAGADHLNQQELPKPTSIYASSTENISRLLKNWVENSPNNRGRSVSYKTGSTDTANSSYEGKPESFDCVFEFDSSATEASETSLFDHEERRGSGSSTLQQQTPLSMLETWLFDESCGQGGADQDDLVDISNGLF